ncbi:MAG: four helix bundle protein [Prevotellaceae bacterium]|jgi:four helix bundle protein|nr:four helix bundle protein [Prevotellaceae bacterium]
MKENVLKNKSYAFALRIIKVYKYLCENKKEFVLSKQLLRCGTAIGASVREAEYGESSPDFIHKLRIALKEANEAQYWLELLRDSDFIDTPAFVSINDECVELLKLLVSSIKTCKNRIEKL